MPQFVDVILPLAVPGRFTYSVPENVDGIGPGMRVVVPFGRGRKLYSGLVRTVHDLAPGHGKVRSVLSVLDRTPVVSEAQFALWDMMSEHYLSSLGEIMIASLPSQLVLSSETRLVASPDPLGSGSVDDRAGIVIDALMDREVITLADAGELLGLKDPMPVIRKLMEQGALQLEERIEDTWRPRMITYVRLVGTEANENDLHDWFDKLERKAPKQWTLLVRYVELSRCMSEEPCEVERSKLLNLSGVNSAVLNSLVKKGLFEIYEREAGIPSEQDDQGPAPTLSDAQTIALDRIHRNFKQKDVVLFQGVTSSGKTEVYMTLIQEALERGEQVLYLLPEIALTTQMISRLRARFGERIAVSHSRMPQHERTALWMRMVHGTEPPDIVIGARSAIFLPFHHLGLIVVDEEHDPSYKQHDPSPRYHARDMAVVLGSIHGCKVLLGSATPALESQHNARTGKYGFADLLVRYGDVEMPAITRVDLRDAHKRRLMRGHFSNTLIEAVQDALDRREQAIIFQNRRGYVPVWRCETCSWIPECDHCDVSLTYHKAQHQLRCHYCARHYEPPSVCGSCGGSRLRMLGFGTEKIEEELGELFPDARIARMDQDTTRGRKALDRILTDLGSGAVNILVGTQMVTKGLDFDQVSVVGILNADLLLRYPDFHAHERAFQLMAQVAGRSGRRKKAGKVIIQAYEVSHPILDLVVQHDVDGLYEREIEHRKAHGYPPFMRIVELTLKHRSEDRVQATAAELAIALRSHLGERILGPDIPLVSRVRDQHLRKLLIKIRRSSHHAEKVFVRDTMDRIFADPRHGPVRAVIDVDPA